MPDLSWWQWIIVCVVSLIALMIVARLSGWIAAQAVLGYVEAIKSLGLRPGGGKSTYAGAVKEAFKSSDASALVEALNELAGEDVEHEKLRKICAQIYAAEAQVMRSGSKAGEAQKFAASGMTELADFVRRVLDLLEERRKW
jgi:hypothetical protein